MTHKQMADQVIAWLGLQDIAVLDETELVDNLLFWGTIDLLARTRCVVRCVQLRVDAGVDEYTLDHSVISLVDVENGATRLRRDYPSNRRSRIGTTIGEDPSYGGYGFTLVRADVLLVKPTPSEDGTIQVWAVLRPQQMADPEDSPADDAFGAIPEEWHDAIVTYALWKASDYSDDVSSQQGERYRILYEGQDGTGGRLQQIKVAVNRRGTSRAPQARVALRSQAPHDSWVG